MEGFISDLIELAFESVDAYNSNIKSIEKVSKILSKTLSDKEDVSIEEFLEMFNTRVYNFDNKRADIKIMKRYDFEGVYILYNITKNIYYFGYSRKVMRKIERHFNGFENINIYNDSKEGNNFFVRIKQIDNNQSSVNDLEKELCSIYDERVLVENQRRKREQEKVQRQKQEEQEKKRKLKEEKRQRKYKTKQFFRRNWKKWIMSAIILIFIILLLLLFQEYKKYKPINLDSNALNGLEYTKVVSHLSEKGFENISYDVIEDLTIEELDKENIITKVTIDNKSDFNVNSKFHIDSQIVIQFHTLKKISITMSSDDIIGKDFKGINKTLKGNGFTSIKNKPLGDLILGWFNKENEIKSIKINGIDEFSKGDKFRPDAEIIIEYHSFN